MSREWEEAKQRDKDVGQLKRKNTNKDEEEKIIRRMWVAKGVDSGVQYK